LLDDFSTQFISLQATAEHSHFTAGDRFRDERRADLAAMKKFGIYLKSRLKN
jgi:hypothetical protein